MKTIVQPKNTSRKHGIYIMYT